MGGTKSAHKAGGAAGGAKRRVSTVLFVCARRSFHWRPFLREDAFFHCWCPFSFRPSTTALSSRTKTPSMAPQPQARLLYVHALSARFPRSFFARSWLRLRAFRGRSLFTLTDVFFRLLILVPRISLVRALPRCSLRALVCFARSCAFLQLFNVSFRPNRIRGNHRLNSRRIPKEICFPFLFVRFSRLLPSLLLSMQLPSSMMPLPF